MSHPNQRSPKALSNIVLLSPAHPLRGGIAASTERLAYELQAKGYQVRIYSFRLQYPGFLFPGKTQYTEDPAPAGLRIEPLINSINPLNWWRIGRRLAREKPDLIITRFWLPFMGPALGAILRLAKRNGHTRTLAITDNVIPHESRPGDRAFTTYFIGAVDAFIVMSESVGDDIRQFTREKPFLFVPHPIYDSYGPLVSRDQALQHLKLPPGPRYLLFFGFIRKYKGLDLLLEALADRRLDHLDLKLIVAGEYYGDQTYYEKIIREKELSNRLVLRTTFIPQEEVKYYFGAADLVVQPYRTATQSGISQLAYHFEIPMIVTRVGGLPEIVPHGRAGYVVEVNPAAIAEAILDFFENHRMETMRNGVIEEQKRFSWENMVTAIEKLFSGLK